MATKSVILRPNRTADPYNSDQYPEDVSQDNAYMLVNEEVSDDEATYVIIPSSLMGFASFGCDLPIDRNFSQIIGHVRVKSEGTLNASCCSFGTFDADGNNKVSDTFYCSPSEGVWKDYCFTASGEEFMIAVKDLMYTYIDIRISSGTSPSSSGGKDVGVSTACTQAYIELVYDTSSVIYLYENGSWVNVPGIIYQKQNGTWAETDDSVFSNGDYFISPKS